MARVRVSTTVDREVLRTTRQRLGARDSELFDRALLALLDQLDAAAEATALDAAPYHEDEDLQLPEPELGAEELPYDGEVPPEVVELAERRRRRRASG